jgi:hypothetical protein
MKTNFTRRQFAKLTAAAAAVSGLPRIFAQNAPPPRQIAPGPFEPTLGAAKPIRRLVVCG